MVSIDQKPAPAAPGKGPDAQRGTAPLPTTLDTLESLEEEMAKLLGRSNAGPPKQE